MVIVIARFLLGEDHGLRGLARCQGNCEIMIQARQDDLPMSDQQVC
jgi:hypothetical protein